MSGTDPIVPDDFDWDAARRANSTTPEDDQARCPACGPVKIHTKSRSPELRTYPGAHRCDRCGEHFDEPERPERDSG